MYACVCEEKDQTGIRNVKFKNFYPHARHKAEGKQPRFNINIYYAIVVENSHYMHSAKIWLNAEIKLFQKVDYDLFTQDYYSYGRMAVSGIAKLPRV